MPRIFLTAAARADLAQALAWYESHAPHVVPQFREALRNAMMRIADNPKQFPPSLHETRRALLRRFPYLVIFRETGAAIYVVAIFHTSRDPTNWRRRAG